MNWSHIKRKQATTESTPGVYVSLDDLIRIKFEAKDFSFSPQQPVNSILSGRYASRLRGRGLNFEELRRYRSGDDIRTMDWKVTARTRKPHVRVYTEEKDRVVLLIVDQRTHMFFGTRKNMKSVTAAEVAALGVWRGIDSGDRVGAIVFNDEDVRIIRPERNQKSAMRILQTIVDMNNALSAVTAKPSAPIQLNNALNKALQTVKHDALTVVISDFEGSNQETQKLIMRLAEHNDIIGVMTVDPSRITPPATSITVTDGQNRLELNLKNRSLRKSITDDYERERVELTHFLQGLSAPLLSISTAESTVSQIRRALGVKPGASG